MSNNGKNLSGTEEEAFLDAMEDVEAEMAAEEEAQDAAIAAEEAQAQGEQAEMDPVETLITENADLKDKLLRNMAEMENMRRRAEREKAEATLYAATNFARDVLPVSDNLARALEFMGEEERASASQALKNLLEGVELTQRELQNSLSKHNITRIEPLGEKFDPNKHQAMFEVPDPEAINGTVIQVVQPGYLIGERVLRPAMVGVAKSDKKPVQP
jgi:molecular chaperone GrpE